MYRNLVEVMSQILAVAVMVVPKGKSRRRIYEEETGTRDARDEPVLAGRSECIWSDIKCRPAGVVETIMSAHIWKEIWPRQAWRERAASASGARAILVSRVGW